MIYLIEGVLPESYFVNSLRGLTIDMAVFRDLLRLKLPELSKHLDALQTDSNDAGKHQKIVFLIFSFSRCNSLVSAMHSYFIYSF